MKEWQPPRGTRDFLPEETARRNKLYEKFREVFERYGYGEIETPAFEDFELLAKKSGEDIEEEIYAFEDKGGRKLGLRFDPTVPICRVVATRKDLPKPIKFYYITRMWRYERPQAGRYREFWQAGCELIGPGGLEADVEILQVAADLLEEVGIEDFYFRVNTRKLASRMVREAGIEENVPDVLRSIDKMGDIGMDGVAEELEDKGLSGSQIESLRDLFTTDPSDLVEDLEANDEEWPEMDEAMEIVERAREMGIEDVQLDTTIVRGLDYYTGFVFETFIEGEEGLGSVCSGGRYDSLIGIYGDEDLPAVGFGLGIDRMLDAMDIETEEKRLDVYVAPVNEEVRGEAREVTSTLREEGIRTDTDLMDRSISSQLDYASSREVPVVVIVGPDELESGEVTVKDMESGEQEEVSLDGLVSYIRSML